MNSLTLLYIGTNREYPPILRPYLKSSTVVSNESEALRSLSSNSYDAILIDDSIPLDEALEIIKRIKMVKKSIITVLISINPPQTHLIRAIRLGINDVLIPPLDADVLKETFNKLHFMVLTSRQLVKKNLLLNQYKNALDSSLYISKTNPQGIITYVNERFSHLSGYTVNEIIGQTHRLFKHPNSTREQMAELWNTISSKKVWHGTITNQTKTGEPFYTDTFVIPILNERNEIEEYMDMRIDVTELANHLRNLQSKIDEATKEIRAQQERLIAQSRAVALGEMFDNIAHQWRQPIGAINNAIINAEFAMELGGMSTDEILETFQKINSYTAFLSGTIDDFRNFSNPDKAKTWFTLHETIQQTIGILQDSFNANTISICYGPNSEEQLLKIYGPQGELSQVILNILSNARDALKENAIQNAHVSISLHQKDTEITITIADNGGGIPDSALPKIFDPYFSTKNKAQGTGIGLYMSKTIIEKNYNGKLEARNAKEGAIFTITLPVELDR